MGVSQAHPVVILLQRTDVPGISGLQGEHMKSAEELIRHEDLELARVPESKSRHLPGYYYTSSEILELEKEKLFMKDWLMVGRVEEFPNTGDFRVMDIVGESIIICLDKDRQLNALSNVCRHRGVEVAQGSGNQKDFMCPFHGWTYDLKGGLIAAPEVNQFSEYDFKKCKLVSHKVDTWAGFIFINFDPDSPSLDNFLDADGIRDAAGFLRAEDTHIVDVYTYTLECNWKMMVENNIDMYHVNVIHSGSFGGTFEGESFKRSLSKYGWHGTYQCPTMAPDGEILFRPMPWLENKGPEFAYTFYLRPNFNFFARQDLLQPCIAYPIDPDNTRVTYITLLPKEALNMPAFDAKVKILRDFIELAATEDLAMLKSLQKGFKSRFFEGGPMHELEGPMHHRHRTYLEALLNEGEQI